MTGWSPMVVGLVAVSGMLVGFGSWAFASALLRPPVRLSDALGRLDGSEAAASATIEAGGDRLGAWAYRTLRLPLTARQQQALNLRGTSIAAFYTEKLVFALLGLLTPAFIGSAFALLVGTSWTIPIGGGLVGAVAGFFIPDLQLQRSGSRVKADAGEALFTFFDLVTLERLANQSATQSLQAAAGLSDTILFRQIAAALERARLEQRAPFNELRRLADELDLPALRDIADVMRLDEQGASLASTLRARVRELRDAHLTRERIAAHEVSERMTIFMVLPALVFGLIFLVPPLLRLVLT